MFEEEILAKKAIFCIVVLILVSAYLLKSNDTDTPSKIEEQLKLEEKYLMEFENGDYTLDEPYIIQNPYDSNELAAYVAFHYDEAVTYEYTVTGDIPFTYSSEQATRDVIIPIVGLYYDTTNEVEITISSKSGEQLAEKTIEIATTDTEIAAETATATIDPENEEELTSFMDGKFVIDNYTNIYDQNGDMRAAHIAPESNYAYLKVIDNQFLVPDKANEGDTYNTVLYSYAVTGRIDPDNYCVAPEGTKFHHDIAASDNKLYALTSSVSDDSEWTDSYSEVLLTVYNKNGTIDFTDFYDVENADLVNTGSNADDVHLNSLDYYEAENLLIIDSRSYSQVIGFNLDTEEVEWILDDPTTVGTDHEDLLLSAIGDMEYGSGEHTVYVANDYISEAQKQDGYLYLSMFDNRQCLDENLEEATQDLSEDPDYEACTSFTEHTVKSRAIIYAIDLENKTVETMKTIDFSSYTGFKGDFNMLADEMKTTYVANAHKFEIYNADDELIGTYVLNTNEEGATSEDDPFLYRAVAFDTETFQNFVELN